MRKVVVIAAGAFALAACNTPSSKTDIRGISTGENGLAALNYLQADNDEKCQWRDLRPTVYAFEIQCANLRENTTTFVAVNPKTMKVFSVFYYFQTQNFSVFRQSLKTDYSFDYDSSCNVWYDMPNGDIAHACPFDEKQTVIARINNVFREAQAD